MKEVAKPMRKFLFLFFICLLMGLSSRVTAQPKTLQARVEYISGDAIYLNVGQQDGLVKGDTVYVYIRKQPAGPMRVINAASGSSSVTYAGKPFALTRGQVVEIRFKAEMTREEQQAAAGTAGPKRKSILERGRGQRTSPTGYRRSTTVHGRLSFGLNGTYSTTQWNSAQSYKVKRTFLSPYAGLSLNADELARGLSADINLRWTYRYSSRTPIHPAQAVYIYRMQLEKSFDKLPLHISAGRFYNRYESFSGFWDGVMLRYGSEGAGVGVIGGFQPIRSNEQPGTDLPKYSAFTYFEKRTGDFVSSSELSLSAVYPRNGWLDHRFVGAHQLFRYGPHYLSADIQVDEKPGPSSSYTLSELQLRGQTEIGKGLYLHASYRQRQPYRIWSGAGPVSYKRESYGGGFSYRMKGSSLGGGLTVSDSRITNPSYSWSGYARVNRTRFWKLGFDLSGSYWNGSGHRSMIVSPGLTRWFGPSELQLGYTLYHSDFGSSGMTTHSVRLTGFTPLFRKWYLNAQLRSELGELLMNQSLYIGIWKAF